MCVQVCEKNTKIDEVVCKKLNFPVCSPQKVDEPEQHYNYGSL